MRLLILKNTPARPAPEPGLEVVTFEELKRWATSGRVLRKLFSYERAEMLTYSLGTLGRLLPTVVMMRAVSHGPCVLKDEQGAEVRVTVGYLLSIAAKYVRDTLRSPSLVARVERDVEESAAAPHDCRLGDGFGPLYLRTDLAFGLRSGGSVGHIAGVLNNLSPLLGAPVFVTSDRIPTVSPDVGTHVAPLPDEFRDFGELWAAAYNRSFIADALAVLGDRVPNVVYQRYSHNNHAGLTLSRRFDVPFVVEYNGSEVWMSRHWGRPLRYEALAERVEMANLHGADLIVVVSKAMRDELVERGIDPAKILVNPNGVDPSLYAPEVDGSEVRTRLGFRDDDLVVGFIGTFGRWHGAEVLADAFGRLVERRPDLRERLRLLLIGDGVTMPEVREQLARHGIADLAVLPGTVPQVEGPSYLAACDILASPHVPNPDGTPFFGSPTKLFEYMAMGKPIVASDLDQIGEVLAHDRTAWMVEPGDADALAAGIERLAGDPALRERLGAAAREDAVAHHSWFEHTRRIVEALKERCG